jgi:hypothetical protein
MSSCRDFGRTIAADDRFAVYGSRFENCSHEEGTGAGSGPRIWSDGTNNLPVQCSTVSRQTDKMGGWSATIVTSSLELDNTSRNINKTHK